MDEGAVKLPQDPGAELPLDDSVRADPAGPSYIPPRLRSSRQRQLRASRLRGMLVGCGIALAIALPLLGIGWWIASRHLGILVSGLVRSKAADALNGRLQFARLDIDLAGRAVLTDAAVFSAGEESAVFTCPRAVVTVDFLNFIGPNRGRRAVVVDLYKPQAVIIREPDGAFNVTHLIKPQQQEREPIGVSVRLHDAAVDFTDACLLEQGYPRIPVKQGLAQQLLDELGYTRSGPSEALVHTEHVVASGSAVVNPQREELALDLRIERESPGGILTAKGTAKTDGTVFAITVGLDDVELASLSDYSRALFPRLELGLVEPAAKPGQAVAAPLAEKALPHASGLIHDGSIVLGKKPGQDLQVSVDAAVVDLAYLSHSLPELRFTTLNTGYDARRCTAEFKLDLLGCEIHGDPGVEFAHQGLSGSITLEKTPVADLLAALRQASLGLGRDARAALKQDLPVKGALSAKVQLDGTTAQPQITAQLSSDRISYGKLNLGRLGGSLQLAGTSVTVKDLQCSGGDAKLKLAGSYDTALREGQFSAGAGPLSVAEALDLAARVGNRPQPADVDVQGEFTLNATTVIKAGKPRSSLGLRSDRLVVSGQTFTGISASGSIATPDVRIEAVEATYLAAKPVQAAEFISTGPLRASLRAGGSIGRSAKGAATIALTGKAGTLNLAPQQASASFKIAGLLSDPEIKVQLKSAHQSHPLAAKATGHYRSGWAPVTATLTWYDTSVDFDGKVDFAKQLVSGKLNADQVDLERFITGQQVSGVLSAAAQVGGSFKQPSLSGRVEAPKLVYTMPQRSYQVTSLGAGFKLVGSDTLSINDGKFNFEGNAFTAQGILGKASKELKLECQRFNLLSALAVVKTTGSGGKSRPLQVQSAGPLIININGDPKDPHAVVSYSSGAGSVEGHPFDSAKLAATASLDAVEVSSFTMTSPQGSITANGRASFNRPGKQAQPKQKAAAGLLGLFGAKAAAQAPAPAHGFSLAGFSAYADVHDFDAGVLAPLAGGTALDSLSGKLNGTVKVTGTGKQYTADGTLTLTNGRYQGFAVSEAKAGFSSTGQGIQITDGRIMAEGTLLTASGVIGKRPGDVNIKAQAESLELALVNPFLGKSVPRLKGPVRLDLQLSPGKSSYPAVDITVNGIGKPVYAGETAIDTVSAEARWHDGELQLKQCQLGLQGSTFTASGTLSKQLNQAKLTAQGSNIELALLAPFMPKQSPKLKGKVALDLALTPAKGQYPNIAATVRDTGSGLAVGAVAFSSAQAKFSLQGSQLDIEQCQLAMNGSMLNAGGKLALSETGAKNTKQDIPLDFWVKSQGFNAISLAPVLPESMRKYLPNGTVTCDLQLGGKQSQPLLSGNAQFNLNKLPATLPLEVTAVTGDVAFVNNDFDIRHVEIQSSQQAGIGVAKVTGSGRLSLNPPGLVSGSLDVALAPDGKYTVIRYYDPRGSGAKPLFEGTLGGVLRVTGSREARPVIGGQIVVNSPGEVSYLRPDTPSSSAAPQKSGVLLRDLKAVVQEGTELRFAPASMSGRVDLQASLSGQLTLNGTPGNLDPSSADALCIAGELSIPKGSMFIYGRTVRLEGEVCKLQFSGEPGKIYPFFSGRGAIILPHVLTGNEVLASNPTGGGATQVSSGQDLKVYLNFDRVLLDPASGELDKIRLTSEPPLPADTIRNYLLGGVEEVLTGQTDLTQFVEREAIGYGTGFISRVIENQFGLESFRMGGSGSEANPFYMEMEKQVTPDVSLTYFRNFFSQTGQQEEFGVKYNVFRNQFGSRYQNLDLQLNFETGSIGGNEREFMFMWTTKF